jgi:8-oxo-dGTP diphosphatase
MTYINTPNGFILKKGSFDILISGGMVNQVYGLITNQEGKMLIVLHMRGEWILPGGKLEDGETFVECLKRECIEEANITLVEDSIQEAFYQEYWADGIMESIQIRYAAKLDQDMGFIIDPDESIVENRWVDIDEVGKYLNWGESVKWVQDGARQTLI